MVFLWLIGSAVHAQLKDEASAIAAFIGVDKEELQDGDDYERMEHFHNHPLRVNLADESELQESGLLTGYQIATLQDYKKNYGDILSLSELASIDGFGKDFAARLEPFISFDSYLLPGAFTNGRCRRNISTRASARNADYYDNDWSAGIKYKAEREYGMSGSFAISRGIGGKTDGAGNISYIFKRYHAKVISGDFNARFGQGLALWNGMTMSGLPTVQSFYRRPSGISSSWSFNGSNSFTGMAACGRVGRWAFSGALAFPGIKSSFRSKSPVALLPFVNVSWYGRKVQVSFTDYVMVTPSAGKTVIDDMKSSLDVRWCISGTDVFSEVAFDWTGRTVAALAGTILPIRENFKAAAMLRIYPEDFTSVYSGAPRTSGKCSNEYGLSLACEYNDLRQSLSVSTDAACFPSSLPDPSAYSFQLKPNILWKTKLSGPLSMEMKFSGRYRNRSEPSLKTELRTDLDMSFGHFMASSRLHLLYFMNFSFLSYVECGYIRDRISLYLRQGIFRADKWDDRIYAYERDAPGSFNVPAYYGRGVWAAFYMSWRLSGWGKLYFRTSLTAYPFMEEKKPGKAELKLQLNITL